MIRSHNNDGFPEIADNSRALDILQGLQEKLEAQGDTDNYEELARLQQMLASPLFQQLLVIQHSVKELNAKLKTTSPEAIGEFDFAPTGEIVFANDGQAVGEPEYREAVGGDQGMDYASLYALPTQRREPDAHDTAPQNTLNNNYAAVNEPAVSEPAVHEDNEYDVPPQVDLEFNDDNHEQIMKALSFSKYKDNQEFLQVVESLAQNREVETVRLSKPEEGGLGFSVVGLKSDNRGELGIFIQEIQPDGVSGRWVYLVINK